MASRAYAVKMELRVCQVEVKMIGQCRLPLCLKDSIRFWVVGVGLRMRWQIGTNTTGEKEVRAE